MELVRDDQVQNKFFTIVGKVTYLNVKNMFRKINVQDKNNDVIDLVLWEEVKDVVLMEKIYKFTDLRVKYKPDMKDSKYIELQSSKKTTISILDPIEFQAMSIQPKPVQQHRSKPYNPTVSYPQ